METNSICCGYFEKISNQFMWGSVKDEYGQVFITMPFLYKSKYDYEKIRIVYCPVCGSDIREIQIPLETFKTF